MIETIIILIGLSCGSIYDIDNALVACASDDVKTWHDGHAKYFKLEKYYHVVYVIQYSERDQADKDAGIGGYAWWGYVNKSFAWSTDNIHNIKHELQHLECECDFHKGGYGH